jgi:hypothetical protein
VKGRLSAIVVFTLAVGWCALSFPPSTQAVGECLVDRNPWEPPDNPMTVTLVGTVADTQNSQQNALIHVNEVWYGQPVPEYLAAIQAEPNVRNYYVDLFAIGQRYVMSGERDGDLLHVTCGSVLPYTGAIEVRTPTQVSEPLPGQRPIVWGLPDPPEAVRWLLWIGFALFGVALLLYAASRSIESMRSSGIADYAALVALVAFIAIVSSIFAHGTVSQIIT